MKKWKPLKPNPWEVPTKELEKVLEHNNNVIDFIARQKYSDDGGCAAWEEAQINKLSPYAEELERRISFKEKLKFTKMEAALRSIQEYSDLKLFTGINLGTRLQIIHKKAKI